MKKILILILIFLAVISIIPSKFPKQDNYTTAICNEQNFCQDNIIKCQDNKVISITPITGASVQFSKNWQDPRTKTEFCR